MAWYWVVLCCVLSFVAGYLAAIHVMMFLHEQVKTGRIRKGKDGDMEVVNPWEPKA